jgi:hypothetical protein
MSTSDHRKLVTVVTVVAAAAVGAFALAAPAAAGSWAPWGSLGFGTGDSEPAVVDRPNGNVDVFAVSQSSTSGSTSWVEHTWWSAASSSWNSVEALGAPCGVGNQASAPGAIARQNGRIDVFVSCPTNSTQFARAVRHRWWTGSAWANWETLAAPPGSGAVSAPSATQRVNGVLDVVVVSGDDVYHMWYPATGGSWSAWGALDNPSQISFAFYNRPSIVGRSLSPGSGASRLDVFATDGSSEVWHKWWTGASWSTGWESMTNIECHSGTGAASRSGGYLDLFCTDQVSGVVKHRYWNDSTWSSWEPLGAPPAGASGAPAAAVRPSGVLDLVVGDPNGAIFHRWWS